MASRNECAAFTEGIHSLPNEILLMIFSYLPPSILVELQGSGIDRVREALMLIKICDFNQCRFMSQRKAEMLISFMRHNLTELYADDMICINPTLFAKAIMMCKNLCVLSVRHSGFSMSLVIKVLSKLKNVVDFSWSVEPSENKSVLEVPSDFGEKWTKLTLDVHSIDQLLIFWITFASKISNLIYVKLNFYVIGSPVGLARLSRAVLFSKDLLLLPGLSQLRNLKVNYPVSIFKKIDLSIYRVECIRYVSTLVEYLYEKRDSKKSWECFWFANIYPRSRGITPPITFNCATKELIVDDVSYSNCLMSALDGLKPNSIEALGINSSALGEAEMQSIEKCGGSSLKRFLICNYAQAPCVIKDYDLFISLFKTCRNIIDFDARGIHVARNEDDSLCVAIGYLKGLKRLCLSVCAISGPRINKSDCFPSCSSSRTLRRTTRSEKLVKSTFEEMISSCSLVEEFILCGCKPLEISSCKDEFSDPVLKDIYLWCHLRTLRIELVETIRLCSFLTNIAKHCKQFSKLQLIGVGYPTVFHFTPNLCLMFKNSRSLKHVKIVHKSFNINVKTFWDAVSRAENLEGLCIATNHRLTINSGDIADNIAKLDRFHSFHLYCDSEPSNTLKNKLSNTIATKMGILRNYVDVTLARSSLHECEVHVNEPACPNELCCKEMIA